MLNGAAVVFPAVFVGAVVGLALWYMGVPTALVTVFTLATAVAIGYYCYGQLKPKK